MIVTIEEYFGQWMHGADASAVRIANAEHLIAQVNALAAIAIAAGVIFRSNPKTGTVISGKYYGGFRPQACPEGAPHSAHKEGLAIDLYDPAGEIDAWCENNINRLCDCGIYIEAPTSTQGWSHWTVRRPGSGNRVFLP